jgi:hypothetical protein
MPQPLGLDAKLLLINKGFRFEQKNVSYTTSCDPKWVCEGLKGLPGTIDISERAQFDVATLDDLKVTILTIQAEQRARKGMMHMGRIQSFLEAMEQFGKVIEVFLNTANMLAFVWGPIKLLLLVCLFRPAIPLGVIAGFFWPIPALAFCRNFCFRYIKSN